MNLESRDSLGALCVASESTLLKAMAAIEQGGRGIAFVLDSTERVVGAVTDGDIRGALLRGTGLEGQVSSVMSTSFYSVTELGNHRARAMELMVAHSIKQVPVMGRAGRLVGLHAIEEYLQSDPVPNWAVILAGGKGTRLRPITEHIPKPMVRVAGRPILERLVLALVGSGIRRIFLSVNYKRDVIQEFFGDGSAFGCRIEYLEEERPLGTGGPLALLPEVPREPLILMNGDLVGDLRIRQLLEHHQTHGHAITMGVGLHAYQVPYGVVDLEGDTIVGIREKPWHNWWVNHGVYAISPEVLPLIVPDVEYPVTDLINSSLATGASVGSFQIEGEWHDVGRPEDLRTAQGHRAP